MTDKATSDLWWKNAVIYCADVATWLDSNGDGIGRPRGPDPAAGLPVGARRQHLVDDAVLPVAAGATTATTSRTTTLSTPASARWATSLR